MREIRITMRCLAKPREHAKVIRVKAKLGRRKAQDLADLLDGTSLAYVHPPGLNSPIGRCCQCQGEVECSVSEVVNGTEVDPTPEEALEAKAHAEKKDERRLREQLR
jgi:hypothetical protein